MSGTLGYNFIPGTKIRSNEVNYNFEWFRGHYLPITQSGTWANTTGVYDLGSSTYRWRAIYLAETTTAFGGVAGGISSGHLGSAVITPAKIDSIFGTWVTRTTNTVYQANKDLIITAFVVISGSPGVLNGYTDSSNPPTTLRAQNGSSVAGGGSEECGVTFPVRKGDYWKITGATTIYELPIGV